MDKILQKQIRKSSPLQHRNHKLDLGTMTEHRLMGELNRELLEPRPQAVNWILTRAKSL